MLEDVRAFEVVRGVPRLPEQRRAGRAGTQRHGDAGIALLLSHYASRQPAPPMEVTLGPRRHEVGYEIDPMREPDELTDALEEFSGGGAW